jgi:hypothetical protein
MNTIHKGTSHNKLDYSEETAASIGLASPCVAPNDMHFLKAQKQKITEKQRELGNGQAVGSSNGGNVEIGRSWVQKQTIEREYKEERERKRLEKEG